MSAKVRRTGTSRGGFWNGQSELWRSLRQLIGAKFEPYEAERGHWCEVGLQVAVGSGSLLGRHVTAAVRTD